MKLKTSLVTAMMLVATASASANSIKAPVPGNLDSKIVTYAYTPDVVYTLPVTVGMHTQIILGRDEELIEVPRLGDKIRWRVEGNEKNLYIKATAAKTNTSLSLVTSKRTYQFELKSTTLPAERIQQVSFSYPDTEAELRYKTELALQQSLAREAAENTRLEEQNLNDHPIDPSQLRFLRVDSKDSNYLRMHAYTDGYKTWMRMPNGIMDLPAVFMVSANERGKESLMPINYTVVDRQSIRDRDVIVIERTAPVWLLRVGQTEVRVTQE